MDKYQDILCGYVKNLRNNEFMELRLMYYVNQTTWKYTLNGQAIGPEFVSSLKIQDKKE